MRLSILLAVASPALTFAAEPKTREPEYDGQPLSAWVARLRSEDRAERAKAATAVRAVTARSQAAVAALVAAAADEKTDADPVLFQLVTDLGPAPVPALTRGLWDESVRVRLVSVHLIDRIGFDARAATPSLVAALADPDARVRALAAGALSAVGARSAVPELIGKLKDADPLVRAKAARAAVDLGAEAKAVLPTLTELLGADEPGVVREAAVGLSGLGPEAGPAVADLRKRLAGSPTDAALALRILAALGPAAREVAPAVRDWLNGLPADRAGRVRLEAAITLWAIARHPDVPELLKAELADPAATDPATTAEMLWRIDRAPAAITALVARLKEAKDERAAAVALTVLASIGPPARAAAPEVVARLSAGDPAVRAAAADALFRLHPPAAQVADDLVRLAGDDPDGRDRLAAAAAAFRVRPDSKARQLVERLWKDGPPTEKLLLVDRVGLLGSAARPLAPALKGLLTDPDEGVRHGAALALWKIDRAPEALPVLIALLDSPDPAVRERAAVEIGFAYRADGTAAVPALVRALWDPKTGVRQAAAEALGRIGPGASAAVRPLAAVLRGDEYEGVQSAACEALGLIGPAARPAVPALKTALEHPDRHVRVHSALALWLVAGDRSGEAVFGPVLTSRNYRERIVGAEARWRLNRDPAALELLARVVTGMNPNNPLDSNAHYMAIRALGRIGPPARAVVPDLVRRRHDIDPAMAQTVAEALRAIDPKAERN